MLMYLCPALMDWLLFFAFFAVFYSAGVRGLSMHECAILGILIQVAYMVFSLVVGHLLNRRNAKTILLVSTVMCGIFGVWSLCVEQFGMWSILLKLRAPSLNFSAESAYQLTIAAGVWQYVSNPARLYKLFSQTPGKSSRCHAIG